MAVLTAVPMALSLHWNHKYKDDTDSNPRGSVCTPKSQTLVWYWQQSSLLRRYTKITNTRTILTAVPMASSLHWNYDHEDNTDGSTQGSVLTLKSQTRTILTAIHMGLFLYCNYKHSPLTTVNSQKKKKNEDVILFIHACEIKRWPIVSLYYDKKIMAKKKKKNFSTHASAWLLRNHCRMCIFVVLMWFNHTRMYS